MERVSFQKWLIYLIGAAPAFVIIYYSMLVAKRVCDVIDWLFSEHRRILILTNDFPPDTGGIQTYSYETAKNLTELGEDVLVLAPESRGCKEFDRNQIFKIIRMPLPANNYLKVLSMCLYTAYYYFRFLPSVVFSTAWFPAGVPPYLLRLRYIVVAHALEILVPSTGSFNYNIMMRVLNASKKVIAVSSYTKNILLEKGVDNSLITIITNGVNLNKFKS